MLPPWLIYKDGCAHIAHSDAVAALLEPQSVQLWSVGAVGISLIFLLYIKMEKMLRCQGCGGMVYFRLGKKTFL